MGNWQQRPRGYARSRGRNPLDSVDRQTRCTNCESINHWYAECPDLHADNVETPKNEVQITLFQSGINHEQDMKGFVRESLSAAVVDCGASKTVCGHTWLNCYLDTLQETERSAVKSDRSCSVFKLGDEVRVSSNRRVVIPAHIGDKNVSIQTEVVDSDVPLLFSKPSLQRANAKIDFENDTITMLGTSSNLLHTSTGHYAIPIGKEKALHQLEHEDVNVTLVTNGVSNDDKRKV